MPGLCAGFGCRAPPTLKITTMRGKRIFLFTAIMMAAFCGMGNANAQTTDPAAGNAETQPYDFYVDKFDEPGYFGYDFRDYLDLNKAFREYWQAGNHTLSLDVMTAFDLNAIDQAVQKYLGIRYRYGGMGHKGIDCSAFTLMVFKDAFGILLPRTASAQKRHCKNVNPSDLRKGDLVFLKGTNGRKGGVTHVGIYMGNGKIAHASSSQHRTIIADYDEYWTGKRHFAGIGRVRRG